MFLFTAISGANAYQLRGQPDPDEDGFVWKLPPGSQVLSRCGEKDLDWDGIQDWVESELAWAFRPYLVFDEQEKDSIADGTIILYQAFPEETTWVFNGWPPQEHILKWYPIYIRFIAVIIFPWDKTHKGDTQDFKFMVRSIDPPHHTKWELVEAYWGACGYSCFSSHSTCRKTCRKRRFDHSTETEPKDTPGIYKRRKPWESILYRVVQQNLETWLTARREADPESYPIPGYVEAAFRKYLQCGIWAYGFARCRCPSCGYEYLLSFSCQIRGLCPSCNAKHMAQTAAHLVDNVLPFVPFRQVVLTVPKRIRFFLQNSKHKRGIQRIFLRALETAIRKGSPGAPKYSRFGAVVFTHRSGNRTSNGLGLPSDTWARWDRRLCRSSVK